MIKIVTMSEIFYVNRHMQLGYTPDGPFSDLWILLGAVEYKNVFGRSLKSGHYSYEDVLEERVPWFYGNGVQRCFVRDLDHGVMREWRTGLKEVTVSTKQLKRTA